MTTQAAEAQHLVKLMRAQFGLPDLMLHLTRLLAVGQPVTVDEVAAAGGWTVDQLRTELARHPSVEWDDDGRIAGFGLTLRATRHRFTFDDRTVYAFCATDTFEFPVILGRPGVVESVCPATGQTIRVELAPDRVLSVDPPQAVVTKIRPDHPVDDVRAEICDLGSFFASPQAAGDWLTHHPDGAIAPVHEDFEITRQAITQLGWAAK
ncbi:alkylmercury lyase [Kribbella sp. VKM Ac-2527]|uniref:Alkylmercury lyase n=1 Tax=Kribbella caucasensis TaxID=2512215 RepID=A0A4R6K702_9ACTN|nr:organomercurial lyase MerB [Kribbella sp. VKM Ac-2527]TDO44720.1 alkylmercury lyase [Kribbella sp. VKM Ac-2527]